MKYVTFTNNGSVKLCHNMILSLRRFTEEDIIVFCLDEASIEYLKEKNINNLLINNKFIFKENYCNYGTQEFKQISFIKLKCIFDVLNTINENIFFIDSDVFFAQTPTKILSKVETENYDLVCQTDRPVGSKYCTGVMFIKNNQEIKNLFKECLNISEQVLHIENDSGEWHDQAILNHIVNKQNIKINCFDTAFSTNGYLYFSSNGPKERLNQTIIHANFCVGIEEKTNRFKSENMWLIS